ncbi:MAG TPA: GNAT family N-acetyltransferase [Longimicrobium sp.]|nr:GNAT family N-acetyltransferase [Longimicrobium sp.]
MPIEIRVLRRGDEGVLARVADDVFDDPVDAAAAAEFVADPRHHLAVAVEDGVVVGFASGVHYVHPDKPRPEMWINEVGVSPRCQGRGVGKAVVDALLEAARGLGCSVAWVLTERDNTAAMRLYASRGGVEAEAPAVMFEFPLDDPPPPRG